MKLQRRLRSVRNALHQRSSILLEKGAVMEAYKVILSPSSQWTRLLVTRGPDELLRAMLPPPTRMGHECAASTLLEALALWLDVTLPVVLFVDASEAGSCLRLTDAIGQGVRSAFYRVEVAARVRRRRRGRRLHGVGEFADLRQLCLVSDDEGV